MAIQKRIKTEEQNIYYNMVTGKYDVKYNFKVYNAEKRKNDYKAKWKYGIATIAEAKAELEIMKKGNKIQNEKEITLWESYELWKNRARIQNYSKATIANAEHYIKMLSKFISMDTPINEITEEMYEDIFARCREKYKDETIKTLNVTFRKLVNLTYKKRLVNENPLARADNVKAGRTEKIRIITIDEWKKIDGYFSNSDERNRRFRFMLNILYYTGIRIGECMALTWEDFEEILPSAGQNTGCHTEMALEMDEETGEEKLKYMRLNITKSVLQDGTPKNTTKNKKNRKIPLSQAVIKMYTENCQEADVKKADRIFTETYNAYIGRLTVICRKIGIPHCSCHSFRHTFISNLMRKGVPLPVIEKVSGDTQKTIFDRYSHMFEDDEDLVLKALENI